jgi:hypothetical protein
MDATPIFFGTAIKIGSRIQPTRDINLSYWLDIYAYNRGIFAQNLRFLRSNLEMHPLMNHMPDFFTQCTTLHKYLHRVT